MWPQTQPVTAPKAPVSEATRNRNAPEQAPLGLDADGVQHLPGQARRGRELGRRRGSRAAAHGPDRRVVVVVLLDDRLVGGGRRAAGGTARPRRRGGARGPCWTTRPDSSTATCSARSVVESRWATRMPVRPEIRRSAARTTRASVTGSIRAVASSSTTTLTSRTSSRAKATSCSSPAERLVPPGPRTVSRPCGQAGHPVGEAELGDRRLDVGARDVVEEGDVVGEGAGEDLGALGDDADRGAQLLEVEVEHVDARRGRPSRAAARRRARAARPGSTCRSRCGRRARRCGRRGAAGRRRAGRRCRCRR